MKRKVLSLCLAGFATAGCTPGSVAYVVNDLGVGTEIVIVQDGCGRKSRSVAPDRHFGIDCKLSATKGFHYVGEHGWCRVDLAELKRAARPRRGSVPFLSPPEILLSSLTCIALKEEQL